MEGVHVLFDQEGLVNLAATSEELEAHVEVIFQGRLINIRYLTDRIEHLVWVVREVLEPNSCKDLSNTAPEAVQDLTNVQTIEEAFFTVKHLVENVVDLLLATETDLGDAVFVLSLYEGLKQCFDLFEHLVEVITLHIDIEHLLGQDLLVFYEIKKFLCH